MIKVILFTVLGICSTIAITLSGSSKVQERLYLDEPEIILDDVKQFENVHFSVRLVNATLQPVTILSTSSSCTCTVPELDKKSLEPAEQAEIKIVFKAGGLHGEIHRKVDFICGYKDKTLAVTLNVKARIRPNLEIDRESIQFDKQTTRVDFRIRPGVLGLERVVDVSSTTDLVELLRRDADGHYTAVVRADAKSADVRGHTIVVRTTDPPACWPRIPLYVHEEVSRSR